MPTKTLDRRPRRIPRRGESDWSERPIEPAASSLAPEPVLLHRSREHLLSPNGAPLLEPSPPIERADPLAGLTRAQRQAQRKKQPSPAPPQTTIARHRARRLLGDILVFGLIGIILFFTWPVRFGGDATFVVVHGHSMDPTFRSGDLVLVRSASEYQVGDIAAYHIPKGQAGAGSGVIHRIVRREGDRYVFKGDNRATADQWRPRASDIIGRLTVRLPLPGETFWAMLPWAWCLAVGGVVTWMLWPQSSPRRSRRPGRDIGSTTA